MARQLACVRSVSMWRRLLSAEARAVGRRVASASSAASASAAPSSPSSKSSRRQHHHHRHGHRHHPRSNLASNNDASRVAWTTVAPPRETTRRDVSSTTAAAHTNYDDDARDLAYPEIEGDLRVTSTDNAQVKHFAKLVKNRAYRDEKRSVVVAGGDLLTEIFQGAGGDQLPDADVMFARDDVEELPRGVRARVVIRAPEHVVKKASGLRSADGVDFVASLAMPSIVGAGALTASFDPKTKPIRRVLALDGIQDPGNLGTLVRTSLALGWDAVALLPGTCDPFNDKVRFASDNVRRFVRRFFPTTTPLRALLPVSPSSPSALYLSRRARCRRGFAVLCVYAPVRHECIFRDRR